MKSDQEAIVQWYSRLYAEWLPHWVDMPELQFQWWNLLVKALQDAADD